MASKFLSASFLSVIGIGFVLAVTVFLVNQPQDIRQQASNAVSTPTPDPSLEGCPDANPDGRTNMCRAVTACPAGEFEKESGNQECTQRLGKFAKCCTAITPR